MMHEANCGRADVALPSLAGLRELAGDHAGADRIRRYGLTDGGVAATSLDFDPPGDPSSVGSGTVDDQGDSTKCLGS